MPCRMFLGDRLVPSTRRQLWNSKQPVWRSPDICLFVGRCDLALGLLMSLASCCEGSVNHWEWEGSSPLRGGMALGLAAARMDSGPSAERCCGARRAQDCL